ncbi:oligosaccharide flippase family protein [Massilia glaciei]|uniref:Polysaccharide biosynthesis protein n=1 Tax=Massilia glaciei TaxID=1524097 RepID=A0A2U2HNB3_9BURK|nr:oligosaccharide flippase family protein [Massilia glaciei]PWF48905.1 polysaccharide biosynthesis protein [Massilia glaciei]
MSLKRNVVANYVGQIYVTLISIVMVPLYVRYMGAEAYGLVGFFAMLQAWFMLLDMGLTPTMARETARFNGGAIDARALRSLLRALEVIFVAVAVVSAAVILAGAGAIARSWLKVEQLPLETVTEAIMLMGGIIALRWVCGLYRGVINGFERLVWLNTFNVAIATARFVLVIPLFKYVDTSISVFFAYQLLLAFVEVLVLVCKTYVLLPKTEARAGSPFQFAQLRGVLKFSLTIAFTGSVWVLVTQTDKLVLSKLLPLAEYAYFTLAVLVAGGVMVISGPISLALLPRLTRLSAAGNDTGMVRLYRAATQLVAVIATPAALVLAFFSESVLWAWTGNAVIAREAAPILALYALGNGILVLGAFPYYLQFAKGDLKLHLIGNILFVVLLIPVLILATIQYGVRGAGYAWLGANTVYFICWVPRVHSRFVKGLHAKWLLQDLLPTVGLPLAGAMLLHRFVHWPEQRLSAAVVLVIAGLTLLGLSAAGSSWVRDSITARWNVRSLKRTR